ncbi:MAG: Rrf2 family transcriptional regulator [Gammaproteobacteria bacterium]|nr:Rrf2 family transcriptional regulator [Gammaproteobacteria bacterium]
MRLTTRRRYAVTAMLDLALNQDVRNNVTVSLSDISKRQGISQSYLEQLFAKLRKHALVKSSRGPFGGYIIDRPLNELTVADVIEAIEEKRLERTQCGGLCRCNEGTPCLTWKLWKDLGEVTYNFLNSITFQHLVSQNNKQCFMHISKTECDE